MFRQIHKTIKVIAVVCATIGILAIPVGIIIDIAAEGYGLFLGTISGGGLILLIQSWFIYGFGQLIENSQRTVLLLEHQMLNVKPDKSPVVQPDELPEL